LVYYFQDLVLSVEKALQQIKKRLQTYGGFVIAFFDVKKIQKYQENR
jgi:hypothetical protein